MWHALSIFPLPSPASEAFVGVFFANTRANGGKRQTLGRERALPPMGRKSPPNVSGGGLQPAVDGIPADTQFSRHGGDVAAALP